MIPSKTLVKDSQSDLIKGAIEGDESAYRQLLDNYRGAIFNLLYKMVRNKEETEDLVQEAFMKAFKALPSFNEEYAFSTWLYKIAINNCIDHMRKKRLKTYSINKPVQSKDGELDREFPDTSMSPDRDILSDEKSYIRKLWTTPAKSPQPLVDLAGFENLQGLIKRVRKATPQESRGERRL